MRRRRSHPLTVVLYLNAIGLGLVALAIWGKSDGPSLLPAAMAQQQAQPIAGGAGLYLMPGQLSSTNWGCYVMDVDRQTLMVYKYLPGEKMLRLEAARDFTYDRRLRQFNTDPKPSEIKSLTDAEAAKPQTP